MFTQIICFQIYGTEIFLEFFVHFHGIVLSFANFCPMFQQFFKQERTVWPEPILIKVSGW